VGVAVGVCVGVRVARSVGQSAIFLSQLVNGDEELPTLRLLDNGHHVVVFASLCKLIISAGKSNHNIYHRIYNIS
jgi:hypothetical protein